ncbi:uncharacterized secreted protein ARB_06907-like isoform X2 [Gigantopelta aegis]|uniref:uncharacterized secreted protein ARB_06907-like isoform X2 n=1 Tax=Gigantopelta aegis TaxID=1735272 RepID=UPI001B88C05C|nr:uncharacterized secreted protein ARB_06907-like isoform X2 [Gigantopelta aegis]
MNYVCLITMLCFIYCFAKKKEIYKSPKEFLESEEKRLKKGGVTCSLKKISRKGLDNLRLQRKDDVAVLCLIKYLIDQPDDGFQWSVLATIYSLRGKTHSSQAESCFNYALKISGKVTSVTEWQALHPFVIGKMELDGDPLEAFGGIHNVSLFRFQKGVRYFSELVTNGEVRWITVTPHAADQVQIGSQVNWNDLVSSLGSMGITEWQGWLVGEFAVNENDGVIMQCMGASTVFIDGHPVTGDVYSRSMFWFSLPLTKGLHTVFIRIRTKVQANLKFSVKLAPKIFKVLSPSFLPDLVNGYIFGRYISVPISNYHATKWLTNIRVSLVDQSDGETLEIKLVKNDFAIAPGQVRPVVLKLTNSSPKILDSCYDIDIEIKITTSEGQELLPLKLRCRKSGESFHFTFLDHDGSVQHGAAVQPIGECAQAKCPVMLTLHGTTVPPQNQADSYKKMVDGDYEFGVDKAWLIAPTRFGAHNWEGPGALSAMSAMFEFKHIVEGCDWLSTKVDSSHVIFAGHSMGGHGAWHLATHYPDRALAVVSLAGWIKKEEYGDSNLFFRHDTATSHTDPAVKAIMEASIAENDADRHVLNLQDVPVLSRIGSQDRTVHPYFVRRMYRLLQETRSDVSYSEIKGKEHWWWDTRETNDGGAVNDKEIRDFMARHLNKYDRLQQVCTSPGKNCDDAIANDADNKYSKETNTDQHFVLVTVNPALGEGLHGIQILQQLTPFRTSTVRCQISGNDVSLKTVNVARLRIKNPLNKKINWAHKNIMVDGSLQMSEQALKKLNNNEDIDLCKSKGKWSVCESSITDLKERGPDNLGPARRVAEKEFVIITGTQGKSEMTQSLLILAVYIANLFFLTSDAIAPIVKDTDVTIQQIDFHCSYQKYHCYWRTQPEQRCFGYFIRPST